MKLKKANAILGLLTMAILLIHAGYQVIAYVLFLYDPMVTRILAWATAGVCSLHAVLGMSIVMFRHDGSTAAQYPEANLRTVIQRASAIGMLVMLVLHVKAYDILKSGTPGLIFAELVQVLFFSCVFAHIATSFTNAFITLGVLSDMERKKKNDRAVWVICVAAWAVCVFVIGRTYLILASMP